MIGMRRECSEKQEEVHKEGRFHCVKVALLIITCFLLALCLRVKYLIIPVPGHHHS